MVSVYRIFCISGVIFHEQYVYISGVYELHITGYCLVPFLPLPISALRLQAGNKGPSIKTLSHVQYIAKVCIFFSIHPAAKGTDQVENSSNSWLVCWSLKPR